MAVRARRGGGQTRAWRWTAFSGAALLVLLTVHMVANHFVIESTGGLRTYRDVLDYVSSPVIFVTELLFLVFVTIHAMLGLRSVLFDLWTGERARARISKGLVSLGAATVAYGVMLISVLASRA